MTLATLILMILGLGLIGFLVGRARAWSFVRTGTGAGARTDTHTGGHTDAHTGQTIRPASRPNYHGWYVALWITLPMLAFAALWAIISPALVTQAVLAAPEAQSLGELGFKRDAMVSQARGVANGTADTVFIEEARVLIEPFRAAILRYNAIGAVVSVLIAFLSGLWAFLQVRPDFSARTRVERTVMVILLIASLVAILTTFGIFASLIFETIRFFGMVSPLDFLFGSFWGPDPMSEAATPDGSRYGAIPLFWGTIYIGAIIAMIVAIPLGLMSAIYLTQYASPTMRAWLKPALEILAGVPTVVYGYFAALTVAPAIRDAALAAGFTSASSESALAAGVVMGVMIIPFVSSMADDSIAAVPSAMRDGSLAMGATTSETIRRVLIPAALPGIVAGIMLAISRAIGETMIVVMAAGAAANLTANPLEAMTTVTFQIVAMLTGEGSFDHPATLSAFALGLVLFLITLALNFVALRVVKRFREAYE